MVTASHISTCSDISSSIGGVKIGNNDSGSTLVGHCKEDPGSVYNGLGLHSFYLSIPGATVFTVIL